MILTSLSQCLEWSGAYSTLPYIRKYKLSQLEVPTWEIAWKEASDSAFVLESGKAGRYTFLGLQPTSILSGKGSKAISYQISTSESPTDSMKGAIIEFEGPPLHVVQQWMEPYHTPRVDGAPKFIGGCVGYWGYDVVRSLEKIPVSAEDKLQFPDYYFMMMNELWIIDQEERELYCAVHFHVGDLNQEQVESAYILAGRQSERMKHRWDLFTNFAEDEHTCRRMDLFQQEAANNLQNVDIEAISGIEISFEQEQYVAAVRRIQQYIAQGDVFQVNLSTRQSKILQTEPQDIYEWLRIINPSPYMGYLRFPGFHLVSASPELLVKLENNQVMARPIAGTRPRGSSEQEDQALAAELLSNDKERAEHIMLVDLERNDLGRISRYGSVKVDDFMVIERYSHVMHIVSEVVGELAEGNDAFHVLAAVFPGGTITGAPKIRTMEIIEELEPVRRGPYTGSIGWIDYNGNMEFNIAIRTLFVEGQMGHMQAGAGIVIDSDPEKEYMESMNKAKALWKAVRLSEQFAGRGEKTK